MSEEFTSQEIAALEENLRQTPWERMLKNDEMVNRFLEIEAFLEKLQCGWNFIRSKHGYSS
jgi:hypothetical protein